MIKYFNNCRTLKAILKGIFIISLFLFLIGLGTVNDMLAIITFAAMLISAGISVTLGIIIDDAEKELTAISQNIRELEEEIRRLKDE